MARGDDRGAALLEATIALSVVAMLAATALTAFTQANRASAEAARRLAALSAAETALERASAGPMLAAGAREAVRLEDGAGGLAWTVTAAPYAEGPADGPRLVALSVEVRARGGGPLVALRTLRAAP